MLARVRSVTAGQQSQGLASARPTRTKKHA
jgi:hypothetical protein